MASSRVTLGGVTFQGHEVPEKIPFGGRQKLAKHVLVGGRRVTDAMGYEECDKKWEGRFRGASALSRARAVAAICERGGEVSLSWGGLSFTVVVEEFEADYRRSNDIPYKISAYVTGSGGGGGFDIGAGLDALVGGDLGAAIGLVGAVVSNPVGAAVGALGAAIGGVGSLSAAPIATVGPIQAAAAQALNVVNAAVSLGDIGIDGAGIPDPTLLAGPGFAAALLGQMDALNEQEALLRARGLVGRVAVNLGTMTG